MMPRWSKLVVSRGSLERSFLVETEDKMLISRGNLERSFLPSIAKFSEESRGRRSKDVSFIKL